MFFFLWTKQAWKHFRSGTVEQLYDPNLFLHNHPNGNVKNEILRVVHIGLLCTQKIQSLRPTMSKVLQMLTKKDDHLPAPTKPPFIDESMMKLTDWQVWRTKLPSQSRRFCFDCYHLQRFLLSQVTILLLSVAFSFYPKRQQSNCVSKCHHNIRCNKYQLTVVVNVTPCDCCYNYIS